MADNQDWTIGVIIAVAVVIAVLFIVLAVVWLYCCFCRHRNMKYAHQEPADHGNDTDKISMSSLSLDKNSHETGYSSQDSSYAHARTTSTGRYSSMPGLKKFFQAPPMVRRANTAVGRYKTKKRSTLHRRPQTLAAPKMQPVSMDPSRRLKISDAFRPRSHPHIGFATVGAMTSSRSTAPVDMQHFESAPRFANTEFNKHADEPTMDNISIAHITGANSNHGTLQDQSFKVLESPTGTLQGNYIEGSNYMSTHTSAHSDTSRVTGPVLTSQDAVGNGIVGVAQ